MRDRVQAVLLLLCLAAPSRAGDWPQWRCDANRSAATPHALPPELHLQWTRELPRLEPAWEDPVNRDRMPFDRVYEPVVVGATMFVGSSRSDSLTALDTRTGGVRWRVYADGPVRLPPVAWAGRVAFASDDGWLRCLDAETGELLWRVRGGPDGRKVLGNGRLVSAWPARGGPVLADGTIYFAASIWPFMGTFIHAVDAETGRSVWTQDGLGSLWLNHPHGGSTSFGSVAPQGALAAVGERLLVPCGRSVPACLDRRTGRLLYYHLAGSPGYDGTKRADRKREGGSHVSAIGGFFLNHRGLNTSLYDLATGEMRAMWRRTTYPVLTDAVCYLSGNPIVAIDLKATRKVTTVEKKNPKTGKVEEARKVRCEAPTLWECEADATGALIEAGSRLYAGGKGAVTALDLPKDGGPPTVAWTRPVEGTVARLLAADGRLFAVTLEGRILAFGGEAAGPTSLRGTVERPLPSRSASILARAILGTTGVETGYCLVFGLRDRTLAREFVRHSALRAIAVGRDADEVERLRRRWDAEGVYGERLSAHAGDPLTFGAPPCLARLIVVDDLTTVGIEAAVAWLPALYRSLRPYGGVACFPIEDAALRDAFALRAQQARLPQAAVRSFGCFVLVAREGPLPGSADWTHQYGDIANTAKSDDQLVRLPLGLLWFGGNSHHDVLPRHGHGPPQQVVGGRLFIQGMNLLSARDVYTGQVLWKRPLPDLSTFGIYFDGSYKPDPLNTSYGQGHIPGANARGTNFVAAGDRLYLAVGAWCVVLDAETGAPLATFPLPDDDGRKPIWGYIALADDLLLAGANFASFSKDFELKVTSRTNFDITSSKKLVAMDRHTGRVLWTQAAGNAFRHNAVCVGGGALFCIDSLPEPIVKHLQRRGETPQAEARLLALDLRTGRVRWQTRENVFGTWLSYSSKHDVLVQSGRASRDMIGGEPSDRIIAYRARDGAVIWDKPVRHAGPLMLHGDTIYTNAAGALGGALSLLTGEPKLRAHPLSGERVPWHYRRYYGCNYVVASEHLLTFRSGAAGYTDLEGMSGTGNLGGFKSGCTSNLVAANGVLNAPDYTRTCTCSYQNQTSLALVHMPDVETWTFNDLGEKKQRGGWVRHLGLNLGAPGDRRAPGGTLWLEWPVVGGPTPAIEVKAAGDERHAFRRHSSVVEAAPLPWVAASGVAGLDSLTVTLHKDLYAGMEPLIARHATWRCLAGAHPDEGWTAADFADGAWKTGEAGFGFGDGDDRTVLADMRGKYGTVYIRRTFQAADAGRTRKLVLGIGYDDAFIAYLNGKEVLRVGVGRGSGAAAAKLKGHEAKGYERFEIPEPAAVLRDGANVLAIEGHNAGVSSSDFSLDPYLEDAGPGERVFAVSLQGKRVIEALDVAEAAGGPRRGIVREFRGIVAPGTLAIGFEAAPGSRRPPLLCGVEIVADGW